MRNRLTQRVAADAIADKGTGIMNDPYQVNNPDHEKNDPSVGEYAKGDPSAWGEDVNKEELWKKDKRDSSNIPEITAKMAAEAIQAGRKLEERAVKCIVASQRILPGAADTVIESQAADLMHLSDNMLDSLLGRQEDLANTIAKAAEDTSEECKEDDKKEEKEEKKEKDAAETEEQKKAREEAEKMIEKKAALESELNMLNLKLAGIPEGLKKYQEEQKALKAKKEEKEAAKVEKDEKEEVVEKEEKEAAKVEKEEKEEVKKEDAEKEAAKAKKDEDLDISFEEGEEKDASQNLLDDIFSGVTASDSKKGAKSLSGLVKKEASEGKDPLNGIWDAPPDISAHFH